MKDLKPCPFCGGKAFITILLDRPYIDCFHTKKCLMKPNTWLLSCESIKKQTKAWNQRVSDDYDGFEECK